MGDASSGAGKPPRPPSAALPQLRPRASRTCSMLQRDGAVPPTPTTPAPQRPVCARLLRLATARRNREPAAENFSPFRFVAELDALFFSALDEAAHSTPQSKLVPV